MATKKGPGWHGDTAGHRKAALGCKKNKLKKLRFEFRDGYPVTIYKHPTKPHTRIEVTHRNGWSSREVGLHGNGVWSPWPKGLKTKRELLNILEEYS